MNKNIIKDYIIANKFLFKVYLTFKLYHDYIRQPISKIYFKKLIGKNPIILEIGAHVGTDTAEFAALFDKGTIYAIEPIYENFERLKFKTKTFNNVKLFQVAISNENEKKEQTMYLSSNGCSSSLLKPKLILDYYPDCKFEKTINVPVERLDDFFKKNNLLFIDFIWIDVQGMELNIFKSLSYKIKNIHFIYTEISNEEFYENCAQYNDLKEYLQRHDFKVVKRDFLDGEIMGNVLFENLAYNSQN